MSCGEGCRVGVLPVSAWQCEMMPASDECRRAGAVDVYVVQVVLDLQGQVDAGRLRRAAGLLPHPRHPDPWRVGASAGRSTRHRPGGVRHRDFRAPPRNWPGTTRSSACSATPFPPSSPGRRTSRGWKSGGDCAQAPAVPGSWLHRPPARLPATLRGSGAHVGGTRGVPPAVSRDQAGGSSRRCRRVSAAVLRLRGGGTRGDRRGLELDPARLARCAFLVEEEEHVVAGRGRGGGRWGLELQEVAAAALDA